eukprot:14880997-Alexandrium_andersonii.AAC.1
MRRPAMCSDVRDDDDDDADADADEVKVPVQAAAGTGSLMPKAVIIPGVCHAINNGTKDMGNHLEHWAPFLEKLK